jgi:DNA polymerase-1
LRYFSQRYAKDEKRSVVLKAMLDVTTASGWKTQFLEAFPKYDTGDNILRGRYHVTGTVNGRLSTSEPNMQNMPREGPVRACLVSRFGPRHGRMWTADYKQIELMVFAAIARDRRLIKAFQDGDDIHRITASIIHKKPMGDITDEERFRGKRVNFALATGVGPYKLAFMLGISDDEAKEYMARYFEGYPGLAGYIGRFQHSSPNVLTSPTGRRRNLDITDVRRARNQALNFIPAEVALTVHLIAANTIAGYLRRYDKQSCLACLIHDSLTVDMLIEEEQEVSEEMWNAVELPNSHLLMKPLREAGITFRVDMKAGYSLGDQEEIK